MPKMKSHSGAKTRFKITGSGKVMRRRQNHGHNLSKKSPCRKARISKETIVSPQDSDAVGKMLGIPVKNG
jgi:large subunit ribosomal protein L35